VRGFFRQVPAAPATRRRRLLAIARAHRDAGVLFYQPPEPGAPESEARLQHAGQLLAACPVWGWPAGFTGRRDAFLIILTRVLGHSHAAARTITAQDVEVGDGMVRIRGRSVPAGGEPRRCPRCAVTRWLSVLGQADGVGRHDAYRELTGLAAATTLEEHGHTLKAPQRFRAAPSLLPPIDRHGWPAERHPVLSLRSIGTILATAAARGPAPGLSPPEALAPEGGLVCDDTALAALLAKVEENTADLDARIAQVLDADAAGRY
jgi:hypothetical protein